MVGEEGMKSASDVMGGAAVAVIGAGLVGMGWAVLFERSGLSVRLYDSNPAVLAAATAHMERQLQSLKREQLVQVPVQHVVWQESRSVALLRKRCQVQPLAPHEILG